MIKLSTIIPDCVRARAELRRVLSPTGVLSLTEEFPDPDYLRAGDTVRLAEADGLTLRESLGGFWAYTGDFGKVPGGSKWIMCSGQETRGKAWT